MKNCSEEWISNIVSHIGETYNYNHICAEELNALLADDSLYVGLMDTHATIILDIIARLVAKYT